MAHFKSAAITTTYFEVKYSKCVIMCVHMYALHCEKMLLIFPYIFSIVRFISHCIQHCNWPLCFILLCMCCEIYAVWFMCLIWHNGAYVRSLSRGATCHDGPLFLWTSGGRPWQVLLYYRYFTLSDSYSWVTMLYLIVISRVFTHIYNLHECRLLPIRSSYIHKLPLYILFKSNIGGRPPRSFSVAAPRYSLELCPWIDIVQFVKLANSVRA